MSSNATHIETIAAGTANVLHGSGIDSRIKKLREETEELISALKASPKGHENIKDELADVLFIINQLANLNDCTINDLLHHAVMKNIGRLQDPEFMR